MNERVDIYSISDEELAEAFRAKKYGDESTWGWTPRMRRDFGYLSPDDHYELLLDRLVQPTTRWLDVGCGRFLFPANHRLATTLSDRCAYLHGVDPDETIRENTIVHSSTQCALEDFQSTERFNLVSLRMVAEHVADPDALVRKLNEIVDPGGKVVIYTIFLWSPVPILTWITPFKLHHAAKRILWKTEEKDTFPVQYKMNTRSALRKVFATHGFRETAFDYLDDCRTLARFRVGQWLELMLQRVLRRLHLHYPEVCLLGVYEKAR